MIRKKYLPLATVREMTRTGNGLRGCGRGPTARSEHGTFYNVTALRKATLLLMPTSNAGQSGYWKYQVSASGT